MKTRFAIVSGKGIIALTFTHQVYRFNYPFPPEPVVEFFRANYGPMTRAFASLDAKSQAAMRSALVRLWSAHNRAAGDGTQLDAEYLEVIATRG